MVSVQAIDRTGKITTIQASKINFSYRENNLDKNLIFLSASFKGEFKEKKEIQEKIMVSAEFEPGTLSIETCILNDHSYCGLYIKQR